MRSWELRNGQDRLRCAKQGTFVTGAGKNPMVQWGIHNMDIIWLLYGHDQLQHVELAR